MPEFICNTSPLQYLHQAGALDILPRLAGRVIIPPAVVRELEVGRSQGVDVPDVAALAWISVRGPASTRALPLVTDLGAGEAEVLMLGLESTDAILVLDDGRARQIAEARGLRIRGTLGLLLDAKSKGCILAVLPILDMLQQLRFRVAPATRALILRLAGEAPSA